MKSYLQIFRLLWALKRAEHSLNDCWVDLNSLQRQLSSFPRYVRQSGLQSYSMPLCLSRLTECYVSIQEEYVAGGVVFAARYLCEAETQGIKASYKAFVNSYAKVVMRLHSSFVARRPF